jgi:predicted glutamine amidotransferase
MCRRLAYSGSPVLLKDALYSPAHSLIDQSLHSRLGAEATNGDGFGIGWYDEQPEPGVFHSIEPAWNDRNLHELAGHVSSGHFLHTSVRRSARLCSRPTAIPSGTAGGCSCTTGSSATSP